MNNVECKKVYLWWKIEDEKLKIRETGNPVKRTTRAGRKQEKTVRELRELREFFILYSASALILDLDNFSTRRIWSSC